MYLPMLRKLSDAYNEIKQLDPATALTSRQLRSMITHQDLTFFKYSNAWVVNMDELFAHFTSHGVARCTDANFWKNEFSKLPTIGNGITTIQLCQLFQEQDKKSLLRPRNLRNFLMDNNELFIALTPGKWLINFPQFYQKVNPLGIYQKESLPRIRGQIKALQMIMESYPNIKTKRGILLKILQSDNIKKIPIGGHWLINYDEFEQEVLRYFSDAKTID